MRNGLYTIYTGYDMKVYTLRDNDEEVSMHFKGCRPFPDFELDKHVANTYAKIIALSDMENLYLVYTYAEYKGHKFQVFNEINTDTDAVIYTRDPNVCKELSLQKSNENWFGKIVNIEELVKIWEERIPALGLPMPVGMNTIEYLK